MEEAELDVHVSGITCDGTVVRLEGGSDGTCFNSDITLREKAGSLAQGGTNLTYPQTSATIHEVGSTEPESGAGNFALFPLEGRMHSLRVQFGRTLRCFELTQIPQQEPRSIHEDSQEEESVMRRGAVKSKTIS